METLEKGLDIFDWSIETRCNGSIAGAKKGCNTRLLLREEDIFYADKYGDGEGMFFGCICHECGSITEIKKTRIPSMIRADIQNRQYVNPISYERRLVDANETRLIAKEKAKTLRKK